MADWYIELAKRHPQSQNVLTALVKREEGVYQQTNGKKLEQQKKKWEREGVSACVDEGVFVWVWVWASLCEWLSLWVFTYCIFINIWACLALVKSYKCWKRWYTLQVLIHSTWIDNLTDYWHAAGIFTWHRPCIYFILLVTFYFFIFFSTSLSLAGNLRHLTLAQQLPVWPV